MLEEAERLKGGATGGGSGPKAATASELDSWVKEGSGPRAIPSATPSAMACDDRDSISRTYWVRLTSTSPAREATHAATTRGEAGPAWMDSSSSEANCSAVCGRCSGLRLSARCITWSSVDGISERMAVNEGIGADKTLANVSPG